MNNQEARQIILSELESFRTKPYPELVGLIDEEPFRDRHTTSSGNLYQIEIEVRWDGKAGGDVRVLGAIDDGGLSAFCPLCEDFIKSPLDQFVGE